MGFDFFIASVAQIIESLANTDRFNKVLLNLNNTLGDDQISVIFTSNLVFNFARFLIDQKKTHDLPIIYI